MNKNKQAIRQEKIFYHYVVIYFTFHFDELDQKASEEEDIMKREYDSYHTSSDNLYAKLDKWNTWLREFWEQMPLESLRKKYRGRFLEGDML